MQLFKVAWRLVTLVLCLAFLSLGGNAWGQVKTSKRLAILSIDGLPAEYLAPDSPIRSHIPNLLKFSEKTTFATEVRTVDPSYTYPAHTSIITGLDPIYHGIFANAPFDPFLQNRGGWMWYYEDIRVKTLFDFAYEKKLKVVNIFWPVTVGAPILHNLPQIWLAKNDEDEKLIRAMSSREVVSILAENKITHIGEKAADTDRLRAATALWQRQKPQLMTIYTTDLDTAHHQHGLYSDEAINVLKKLDASLQQFLEATKILEDPANAFVVVSDHGFKKVGGYCFVNTPLYQANYINQEQKSSRLIFRAFGGWAMLLQYDPNIAEKEIEDILLNIESNCPEVKRIKGTNPKLLRRIQKNIDKNAVAVLVSQGDILFSGQNTAALYAPSPKVVYTHGFLNNNKEMNTVNMYFPKIEGHNPKSIKDVFSFSCSWLQLACQKGATKNKSKK